MESQWPFIVSFPIKNGGSFHSYVNVYQRVNDFNSIFPCNRSKLWLTQQKNSAPEMHPTWKVWKQGVMTWDSHAAFATAKPGNHRNRRNRRNHELKQTKERRKTSCCTQKTGEKKRGTKKSNYTATSEPEICGKRYGKMLKTIWKVWKTSKKLEKNIIWHHLTFPSYLTKSVKEFSKLWGSLQSLRAAQFPRRWNPPCKWDLSATRLGITWSLGWIWIKLELVGWPTPRLY